MKLWPFRRSQVSGSESTGAAKTRAQQVLVLCHSADAEGTSVMDNLCAAMEFAKIRYTVLDTARPTAWPDLIPYDALLVCTEEIWRLSEDKASALDTYVRQGGGMMVAYRSWNEHLPATFGLGADRPEPQMREANGLNFETDLVPGLGGLSVTDDDWIFDHGNFNIGAEELASDSRVLVTDGSGDPVAWRREHGLGRVAYWNTNTLFCRALRGIALQTLLYCMGTGVAATAGFSVFQVDDFPPSMGGGVDAPVSEEFPDLDRDGFFFDVWYDDIQVLKRKHGLKLTWYVVMNYHDAESGPDADLQSHAVRVGRPELERRVGRARTLAPGDEYGFHGYNHEPLIAENWTDTEMLERKLQLARELWTACISPDMPKSWVPANNWYAADHVRVLKEVFPEIGIICGLFSVGDFNLGEYREFGPEPWEPQLTCLPREAYGYVEQPELRMMILSQISGMGIWSHFIHPDDIYDIPDDDAPAAYHRNGRRLLWKSLNRDGAKGLYHQLDELISDIRDHYPWLESVTTSEAEGRYLDHVRNTADVRVSDTKVEIESGADALFYIRTEADTLLSPRGGGRILDRRSVEGGLLHVVRCPAGISVFPLRRAT